MYKVNSCLSRTDDSFTAKVSVIPPESSDYNKAIFTMNSGITSTPFVY